MNKYVMDDSNIQIIQQRGLIKEYQSIKMREKRRITISNYSAGTFQQKN
jgi:hypothetical protein